MQLLDVYQDVTWQGHIAGVDAALDTFQADSAYSINQMHKVGFSFILV